jgi:hypothetical protein
MWAWCAGAVSGRECGVGRPGASLTYKLILFLIKATSTDTPSLESPIYRV